MVSDCSGSDLPTMSQPITMEDLAKRLEDMAATFTKAHQDVQKTITK